MDGLKQTEVEGGQAVTDSVKNYYGKVLETSANLKTSACTTSCMGSSVSKLFAAIPDEIVAK